MKTIILSCVGGLTTSMLVERMLEAEKLYDIDYAIYSMGATQLPYLKTIDALVLGPQLAHLYDELKDKLNVPIMIIKDEDFEEMRGTRVLQQVMALLGDVT